MKFKLFLLSAFLFASAAASAQELPIPRFVSFRHGEVNLRTGPDYRYPIKFVYRRQHYPVEVVDEYDLWRQIRELDGTIGWVHRRNLSSVRYGIVTEESVLRRKQAPSSAPVAFVQKGALGKIEECPPLSNSCLLRFSFEGKDYKGWMDKDFFYGVYPREEIR